MITCTSTHCERRQECGSPSGCTGSAKRSQSPCEHCGTDHVRGVRDPLLGGVIICEGCEAFVRIDNCQSAFA